MFSLGWPEFFVILVVALMVVGPKDLPKALFTVGKYVKSARKMGREFQRHVDDMMREAELDDAAKAIKDVGSLNPKTRITKELEKAMDPTGTLKDTLDPTTGLRRGAAAPSKPAAGKPAAEKPAAGSDGEAPKSPVAAAAKDGAVADTVSADGAATPTASPGTASRVAEAASPEAPAAGDGEGAEKQAATGS